MILQVFFLRVAVALLPTGAQPRFFSEWNSEISVLQAEHGNRAASRFAFNLMSAAPRMTMAMRANSHSAYVELSIASLLAIFPAVVLGILAVIFGIWIMLIAQLVNVVGLVLVASGFWRHEGRLLDSRRSRVGLLLVVLGSVSGMAIMRLTDLGPRVDEQFNAAIPNMIILSGLVLLAASNYAGGFRRRVQMIAVAIIAPGAGFSVVVAIVNAAAVSGLQRLFLLIYVVPAGVLAWACYSVADRPQVFTKGLPVEI